MMNWKKTALLRLFCFWKIPLLWWVQPKIISINSKMTVAIPLTRKTRNHLNSMYFGALAMGAESSIAVLVAFEIQDSKKKIDFIFKEFNIRFLKRAEAEVYFICEQVAELKQLVQRASQVSERIEQKFSGYAVVPSKNETEHIIEYDLVISLKNRSLKSS